MVLLTYLVAAPTLAVAAYVIFRVIVRRDYARRGRLSPPVSIIQLLIWLLLFMFPYVYNPAEWAWFGSVPVGPTLKLLGGIALAAGFVLAFGTMIWFGLGRAFGLRAEGLVAMGPYRFTRNPQILGGYCLVLGTVALYPSWYALGWLLLYGFIGHMMILTEEEHLKCIFGSSYLEYCRRVPRYLALPKAR